MRTSLLLPAMLASALALGGCSRQTPAPNDTQLAGSVHTKLQSESALAGQNIQVAVQDGVVTLSGSASDNASRALAGNDAGSVTGVRTVVNNLTVLPQEYASTTAPATVPPPAVKSEPAPAPHHATPPAPRHRAASHPQAPPPPPPQDSPAPTTAAVPPPPVAPPPPAAPPQPVVKTVTLQAGTVIPVRLAEPLSSQTAQPNDSFHATLAADLVSNGMIVAPRGASVLGRVVDAKNAAHIKGNALLSLEIVSLTLNNRPVSLVTDTLSKQGEGRGKNTAEKAGAGALLGTVIGALAGGGKGAAIGAVAGAGAGTGINAATRGQQVQMPAETLLNFTLQQPLTVNTSRAVGSPAPANPPPDQPSLEQRPQ